jgi:hypothetical protein
MKLKDDSSAVLQWSMIILVPRSLKLGFACKWSCRSLIRPGGQWDTFDAYQVLRFI